MDPSEYRGLRRERLRELLDRRGLDAIVLRRHTNFAWYTGGADSRVDHASPLGVADIVVTRADELVLTSTIEAPRMRTEQVPDLEVHEYVWYDGPDDALRSLVGGTIGTDMPVQGARDVSDDVAVFRRTLDPDAIERLRAVGHDATEAVEEAARTVVAGMDELEAATALAAACRRRQLFTPVLLAAADERIARHRHPIPFGARIERRAMLVVSAERGGLYANLTQMVDLEAPTGETSRRQAACDEILRRMRDEATLPGRTLAEAFEDCRRFYREAGFPGEERRHHQGGTTGYGSRELIATPSTANPIQVGQAFAWNPSITGAKAEETFVLLASGPEVVAGGTMASHV